MTDTATDLVPVRCKDCKQVFVVPIPAEDQPGHDDMEKMAYSGQARCNSCHDAALAGVGAAKILAAENARLTSWKTFCPVEFQKPIDWNRAAANRGNSGKVLDWIYGERGLLVMGGPGRCKTRFMWRLLNREWDAGRTMNALAHTEFRRICSTLAFVDIKKAADWIVSLAKVQILFIDDLGKGKSTPASEEGFFDLLDARYKSNLPTLYTSNMEPAQIEAGFTEGYGPGLIRRVLDTTKQIEF